jgi:hypothetical protein
LRNKLGNKTFDAPPDPQTPGQLGIARETTGRDYDRIYAYDKYLKILNEGTEPLD